MPPQKPLTKSSLSPAKKFMPVFSRVVKHKNVRLLENDFIDVECKTDEFLQIARQNQLNSQLLRLPPEIRNRIFEYALGELAVGLQYKPCKWGSANPRMPKETLALLLVSRQRYTTAMIPFTQNTFIAVDAGRLRYFLRKFPRGTSASISRANNIQLHCIISINRPYDFYTSHPECQVYDGYRIQQWSFTRFTGLKHMTILARIHDRTRGSVDDSTINAQIEACQQNLARYIKLKHKDLTVSFREIERQKF